MVLTHFLFLHYLNGIDTTGKIKLTMEIASENGLEFLDFKLKITEGKIRVDVYAKPTNSFTTLHLRPVTQKIISVTYLKA